MNEADSLILQTKSQLKELGDKNFDDNKEAIEYALTELRMAHRNWKPFKKDWTMRMPPEKQLPKQFMTRKSKVSKHISHKQKRKGTMFRILCLKK